MYQVPIRPGETWLRARLRRHVHELLRLALPVIVARAGLLLMALVDTIFVGRYGSEDLAHLSIANAPIGTMMGTGTGLVLGTLVMAANALGRNRPEECGAVWHRALIYGGGIGVVLSVLCHFMTPLLALTGQTPAMAKSGGEIAVILGYGMPAAAIYTVTAFFLEGLKRPVPGMIAMIVANLVNAGVNWLLVFGNWGFPALGADGAAWASTISRIFLALSLVAYVWIMPGHAGFGIRRWQGWRWRDWGRQRQLGYGAGASIFIEAGAFTALTFFAGLLGTLPLAAYSIGLNLISLIFMVALGLGSATAVRVGIAHGRRDVKDMVLAGWVGLGVNTVIMVVMGAVLWLGAGPIAHGYTNDPALIPLIVPVILVATFILVVDGGQVVIGNALRGRGDAVVPTLLHTISYIVVMAPLGWFLGVHLGRGAPGLFEAILIASVVSVSLLATRFQVLARRDGRTAARAGATV
jgi:MATE family multidrug resistance protein